MEIVTRAERRDLHDQAAAVFQERWPDFIFHDETPKKYMGRVKQYFGRFDIMVLESGAVVAGGWGVPIPWSGELDDLPAGYDDALVRAVQARETGVPTTTLSFMAAAVSSAHDKRGLATVVLQELTRRAHEAGLVHVIAPLRPTWKCRYPTVPMEEYATWRRLDGLSIDPWIRTHQRMGAWILGPAPNSMVIEGTVAEWEKWTGMVFPATREYVVPDALNLIAIDRQCDRGIYIEQNLWVQHC